MIDRRVFLKSTFAFAATASLSATIPGLGALAQAAVPQRRSLQGMDLDDQVLRTLRDFVRIMSEPGRQSQPVSWQGFSGVHGTAGQFNFCPHGNWYFLPWHRSYIAMYERAVRSVTGDSGFAMPYWDWTADPAFPAAFGDAPIQWPGEPSVSGRTRNDNRRPRSHRRHGAARNGRHLCQPNLRGVRKHPPIRPEQHGQLVDTDTWKPG